MRDKREPFTEAELAAFRVPAPITNFLERTGARRVLDWGCGRGEQVLALRRAGWDAHGFDISEDFIAAGRRSFAALGDEADVLHLGQVDDVEPFDAVVSYMVLEHVDDLDTAAATIRRATRRGGGGLHLFPARWTPIEPHLGLPFAHWFEGRARRAVIAAGVALGRGRREGWGFDDATTSEVVERWDRYIETGTAYRSNRAIARAFSRAGFAPRFSMVDHRLARPHGPIPPAVARRTLGALITTHLEVTVPG